MTQPTVSKHWRKTGSTHRVTVIQHTSTNQMNGGPVRNPIQRTVRTAHLSVLVTVHNFSMQELRQIHELMPPPKTWGNSHFLDWILVENVRGGKHSQVSTRCEAEPARLKNSVKGCRSMSQITANTPGVSRFPWRCSQQTVLDAHATSLMFVF